MNAVTVVCMKWGTLYDAAYVNRLYAGVRRHLGRPFRFVCMTDDPSGLAAEIEALPLQVPQVPENSDSRWRKLIIFKSGLAGLEGTVLFLDLDLVIVGSLDPFLDMPGQFLVVKDADLFPRRWLRRVFRPERERFYQQVGNTSIFRFQAGAHAELLEHYEAHHQQVVARYRNEQEYLSALLHRQGALHFFPREWVASFKHDCVPKGLCSYFHNPSCPLEAKVVLFAGRPKMTDALSGKGSRWYRRIGPAPWLKKAWAGADDGA